MLAISVRHELIALSECLGEETPMPKKTPRGGKYTTRVNRDGSQQYKRRGCLDMVLAVLSLLALAVGLLIHG